MNCPRCQLALVSILMGAHTARLCQECDGVWFEKDGLDAFLEMGTETLASSPLAATLVADKKHVNLEGKLGCPSCAAPLHRYNFCGDSGVILDACDTHGVWFDDGELSRLIDYVHRCDLAVGNLDDLGRTSRPNDTFFSCVVSWLRGL